MADVLDGGVIESAEVESSQQSDDSIQYIREAPISEVRARMYAERQEKLDGLASRRSESQDEEVGASEDEATDESSVEDAATESTESSPEDGASEVAEAEESLEVQFKKAQERFNSLSANTKALSDQNKALKQQLADFQAQQEQARQQQEYAAKRQEYDAIEAYIGTLAPEHRDKARQYYREKVEQAEWQEYQKYLATEAQTVEQRQAELDLREVRSALPEIINTMVTQIAEHDEVPADMFHEVVKTPIFQELIANYKEQRDLLLIGQTLRAVGLVEKQRLTSRKADNRTQAVQQNVHRRVAGAGTGNNLTAAERMAQVGKGEEWQEFRRQVKLNGLEKALAQRGK